MKLTTTIPLFASVLLSSSIAHAATYYVAVTGSDSGPGSEAAPWRTLQFASDRAVAGDTVIVKPGDYQGFVAGWDFTNDGQPGKPVVFRGEPGARITSRNSKTADGINLEGVSYWVIEGFYITGVPRAGIRSVVNHHVTIRGNTCDSNGTWGILTGHSDDLLIEGNTTSRSGTQHGIYVGNSGDRPVIRRNKSFSNAGCGIHMNGDLSQGGDGVISQAVVEENVLYDNGRSGGSAINADGVTDSIFRNNLLYNNHASGFALFQIDGGTPSTGNTLVNNTVVQAADGRWALQIVNGSTNNKVINNILWNNHPFRGSLDIDQESKPGLVSDFNALMDRMSTDAGSSVLTLNQWKVQTGQDQHSFVSTPAALFRNALASDYHLADTSPARDAGTPASAPLADLEGGSRPSGKGFDIGAYEFRDSTPQATPQPPVNLRIVENR